jgi:hypothetical protein
MLVDWLPPGDMTGKMHNFETPPRRVVEAVSL